MTDRSLDAGARCARRMLAVCCAMIVCSPLAMGADQVPASTPEIADVVLQADGTLIGMFVDEQGKPLDGAMVFASQDQKLITRTTTDAAGVYRCRLPRGGVYRMTAGHCSRDFRVWPADVAPPGAQSHATIVRTNPVVRGQVGCADGEIGCDGAACGCGDACGCGGGGCGSLGPIIGVTTGVAGLVVGGIALNKANDAEDDVAELRAIINSLSP